jgi:hypothetical protein
LAHRTPSYNTKMLLKVIFGKTAFVKFKISNNLKPNIADFKNLKKKIHEQKVSRLLPNFCDFQKEPYPRALI